MKTETTTPLLSESDIEQLEMRTAQSCYLDPAFFIPLAQFELDSLIRDWRAMKAQLTVAKDLYTVASDALKTSEAHNNVLTDQNAALREQLAENARNHFDDARNLESRLTQAEEQEQILQEQVTRLAALAETRSDIIAAKAAHVDDLESRLAQAIRDRDEARKQRRELSGDMLGGL